MVTRSTIPDKASRLDVLMLTKTYALVEGDHDIHQVWLTSLSCSCPAGRYGKACSHARAAQLAVEATEQDMDTPSFTPPTGTTPRILILYDCTTHDFAVIRGDTVIDHCSSYLQGEEIRRDFEATTGGHPWHHVARVPFVGWIEARSRSSTRP